MKESYSKEDIKQLTSKYLKDKYQLEDITYGKMGTFDEIYGGIDATQFIGFKGFIVEANDFKVYMAFDIHGDYEFSDDRQSKQIETDLKQKLKEAYSKTAYLSMEYNHVRIYNTDKELYGYNDYMHSYETLYENDLAKLFKNEIHKDHLAMIYIDGEQESERITKLKSEMDKTGVSYYVYQLKEGVYEKLQGHFDDYDYMDHYLINNGYEIS
ncbi:MAG: hypothetical protein Q4F05_04855 [bacterium]|nr:hypothetical protein [bacterium]